jgi:hypothetical protein
MSTSHDDLIERSVNIHWPDGFVPGNADLFAHNTCFSRHSYSAFGAYEPSNDRRPRLNGAEGSVSSSGSQVHARTASTAASVACDRPPGRVSPGSKA